MGSLFLLPFPALLFLLRSFGAPCLVFIAIIVVIVIVFALIGRKDLSNRSFDNLYKDVKYAEVGIVVQSDWQDQLS